MIEDSPTHRQSIDEISIEDFEDYLEKIRTNRLILQRFHEASILVKNEVRTEQLRKKFTQQLAMFNKEFVAYDKLIDKIEKRVNVLRSLSMEAGEFTAPIDLKIQTVKGIDGNAKKPRDLE